MGGPRASTDRKVRRGEICWSCGRILPEPYPGRERACEKCKPSATHRVYVQFFLRNGWVTNFLEENLSRSAGRVRTFHDFDSIRGMFDRCAESRVLADHQALDYAETVGRGSFWVKLTPEQYAKLKR
jgi:hypothetical protein